MSPEKRHEVKYLIPWQRTAFFRAWLDHLCVRDPKYPSGTINSLYYDTPRLSLYEQKNNSDFRKIKIRLRWYGTQESGRVPVFLEAKLKEGRMVTKAREEMVLPVEELTKLPVPPDLVPGLQPRAEVLSAASIGLLLPISLVTYRRRRYVEPLTGRRIALDDTIRVFSAGESFFPNVAPAEMAITILEVKGNPSRTREVDHLFPAADLFALPDTFSKYAAGIDAIRDGGAASASCVFL